MRIACLQFAPQVGDTDNNLNRADAVLHKANPQDLDLLVLPELAFSGYNFSSLQHITPFLEPTTAGLTSLWARTTALKYNCFVTAGYPEKVDVAPKWPASPEYYNAAITVNRDGETVANYRKSFLYYTDETWALEGPDGFYDGHIEGLGKVAMGICMDLNPYKFETPWNTWEFAYHVLHKEANLVILSMAWLTREDARSYSRLPKEPDMDTLSYWLARLEPLIRAETEGEIIVVMANRTGIEDEAVYAGTSCVLGINDGEVKVYGILGRGERELLVVDTSERPQAKLISEATAAASASASATSEMSGQTGTTSTTTPEPDESAYSIDDMFPPISPVAATPPQSFFSSKPRDNAGQTGHQSLRSSIGELNDLYPSRSESSGIMRRPSSPKSRNASRTRSAEDQAPALKDHGLAEETSSLVYDDPDMPRTAAAAPNDTLSRSRSRTKSPRPKTVCW